MPSAAPETKISTEPREPESTVVPTEKKGTCLLCFSVFSEEIIVFPLCFSLCSDCVLTVFSLCSTVFFREKGLTTKEDESKT